MSKRNGVEIYQRKTLVPWDHSRQPHRCEGRKIAGGLEGYTDRAEAERMARRVVSGGYRYNGGDK